MQSSQLEEEWRSQVGLLGEEIARSKEVEKLLKAEMRRKSDAALELMRKKDELVARRDEEVDKLRSRVAEVEEALREVRTAAVAAVPEESKSSSTYCISSLSPDQTEEQVRDCVCVMERELI